LREQERLPDGCEAKIVAALQASPEVRRMTEELPRMSARSNGRTSVGGYSRQPDGHGGFDWAVGLFYPDRLDTHIEYGVDRSGHLTVRVHGDVKLPRAALEAVERACRH
jgi:hypothetical protein